MKKVEVPVFVLWLFAIAMFDDFILGIEYIVRDLNALYHFLFAE